MPAKKNVKKKRAGNLDALTTRLAQLLDDELEVLYNDFAEALDWEGDPAQDAILSDLARGADLLEKARTTLVRRSMDDSSFARAMRSTKPMSSKDFDDVTPSGDKD